MPSDGPLTERDIDQLTTLGYVKVRGFPVGDAKEMEDNVWRLLEAGDVMRNTPSTWSKCPGGLSRTVRRTPAFRKPRAPEFDAAIDQLLGKGRWNRRRNCGALLYTFPEDRESWDVAQGNWHWHGEPFRNVDHLRDLFIFTFLTHVRPQGGGTLLLEGSHHVVNRFYRDHYHEKPETPVREVKRKLWRSHPWLTDLINAVETGDRKRKFMEESTDVFGHPLRVVELTGEPGEAYITHGLTIHIRSYNVLDRPRFMTAQDIRQTDLT